MKLPPGLVAELRSARALTVLTGAGISAESGLSTFRDAKSGLWSRFRPEELATPEAFRRDPALVWRWYSWRRAQVEHALPNAGHVALARMESRFERFALITQNVDGLHSAAGSREVIELHGSLRRFKCFAHGHPAALPADLGDGPPACALCGSLLRPDVVWFGEKLNEDALARAETATRCCDVFLSIGTSAMVHPAARLPVEALAAGAALIEVNRDPTPLTGRAAWSVRGSAGMALEAMLAALDG